MKDVNDSGLAASIVQGKPSIAGHVSNRLCKVRKPRQLPCSRKKLSVICDKRVKPIRDVPGDDRICVGWAVPIKRGQRRTVVAAESIRRIATMVEPLTGISRRPNIAAKCGDHRQKKAAELPDAPG